MNPSQLRLELIDFTETSRWKWRLRRIFIGYLLTIYYGYAVAFFFILLEDPSSGSGFLKDFAVSAKDHLLITATFGFLGSMFFITRTFIRTVNKRDLPVVWYLARPLQGTLMAVFLYYAFRAGELVFYSGGGGVGEDTTEINVWTISILAILAGAFSEEAYDRLHSIAMSIFKPQQET